MTFWQVGGRKGVRVTRLAPFFQLQGESMVKKFGSTRNRTKNRKISLTVNMIKSQSGKLQVMHVRQARIWILKNISRKKFIQQDN